MQLDPAPEIWVFCAPSEFVERILFQRVEAAKSPNALRKQSGLGADPIILGPDLCVLVLWFPSRPSVHVSGGQNQPALNAGCVQQPNDVLSSDRLYAGKKFSDARAKQMLMVIRRRSDLPGPGIRLGSLLSLSYWRDGSQQEQRKSLKNSKQPS